ncbi:MAG: cytochrome b/b6 domain-containing protein [Gemmatimonadetes bacterium]|nr:cytochrome b/b6 domain-containing protein [Gemmatimonadota bacterium]
MSDASIGTTAPGGGRPLAGDAAADLPLASSDRGQRPYIQRFGPVERLTHAIMVLSFFGLVITGVPLHFSHAPWAATMMGLLGGVGAAGAIHRFFGVMTFGYFFLHLGMLATRFLSAPDKKAFLLGPRSMVPQPKDLEDVVGMFRWFVGKGPRPRFDRYSYMEKFDYWAVFWGIAIIGGSGLLLWFPIFFSRFLPGWMFNVATIVHGDEALLAMGFIFTIHFFNSNLRPEKFPIDVVMFTGRARAEYIEEEHPLEYERELKAGRLQALEVPAPSRASYLWSLTLGFIAIATGLTLTGLVIYAVLQ